MLTNERSTRSHLIFHSTRDSIVSEKLSGEQDQQDRIIKRESQAIPFMYLTMYMKVILSFVLCDSVLYLSLKTLVLGIMKKFKAS